jgi:rhamnosyltransferase
MAEQPEVIDHVSSDHSEARIAAIIVAFRPIQAQLTRLIGVLAQDRLLVYVMDNGGAREALTGLLEGYSAVRLIDMNGNRGIGAALNLGFQMARDAGVKYVVTFDQDSEPGLGLAARLVGAIENFTSRGMKVAAVGPRIIDLRTGRHIDYPFMRRYLGWPRAVTCTARTTDIETDFLITSGCLIPVSTFEAVGPFDAQLFVDCTDMEWCFRARALGYRLCGVCGIPMPHELGTGSDARVLGMTILGHGPARRYYYARNTVRLLKLRHVELGWKMHMLIGLIGRVALLPVAVAFAKGWQMQWFLMLRGILHGIVGVGGPLPLSRPGA